MLRLEIVTPEKSVLDADVDSVSLMTASGEVGILPNHAPLISALRPGVLSYSAKGASEKMLITGGFVEVNANSVAVLADTAETAGEIDVEAARLQRAEAERALATDPSAAADDAEGPRKALAVAAARIDFAGGK